MQRRAGPRAKAAELLCRGVRAGPPSNGRRVESLWVTPSEIGIARCGTHWLLYRPYTVSKPQDGQGTGQVLPGRRGGLQRSHAR